MKIRTLTLVTVLGMLTTLVGCATTPETPGASTSGCPNGMVVPTRKHGSKHRPGFTRCEDGRLVFADAMSR